VRQLNSGQVQIPHTFDAAHVKAIHAHLFQDVYDWAGEFRTVDMAKKGQASLRDLVATEVVERYLVQVWEAG
jgi:cell filamentation protein